MDFLKTIACAILFACLFSSCKYFVILTNSIDIGFWFPIPKSININCVCFGWVEVQVNQIQLLINVLIVSLMIRYCAWMLRVLKSNGKHWKMFEYHQNMWTRWGCLPNWDPMGQSTVLYSRCLEAILRFQKMFNKKTLYNNSSKVYALLHTHLVWRLDLFRMLPGRQM